MRHHRSTILAFVFLLVLLGASAAQSLSGSNTVLSDDIKNGEVHGEDINNNAVSSTKIKDRAIANADLSRRTYFTRVSSVGNQIAGDASAVSRPNTGFYSITFPFSLVSCSIAATVANFADVPTGNLFALSGNATVEVNSSQPNTAIVRTYNPTSAQSSSFTLTLICP